MRVGKSLFWVLAAVLLAASAAHAHVFIPQGCPKGTETQGTRQAGAQSDGEEVTLFGNAGTEADTSIHYLWCFDEGLPSEKPFTSAGGDLPKGKKQSDAKKKIPAGATKVHYVILFDKGEEWTWGTDGWLNL
jgi:hypothetical protein